MPSFSNPSDAIANQATDRTQFLSQPAVIGFYIISVLFNLCLTAQLLTVGLAHFYNPVWWRTHVWLVRGYSGLSLILLAWVYWVPFPKRVRTLTVSLPILLGLQFLTIHVQTPLPFPLAIVHPLIGFALFSASTTLVHYVWRILLPSQDKSQPNSI
ncbi:DUF6220 domain-containing protein [Chroococcidiopsis sp. CCMEE 29]|uniref:DUF6220 domain-containing protein n=1 Tax=Chroococcidiopsis sp. CCMEE 29 TaxID=155894 RepID=UPI002020C38C|nr:DUF6220 domain-containing protein [Chroococcidiopsis sp. CCMEE 29]